MFDNLNPSYMIDDIKSNSLLANVTREEIYEVLIFIMIRLGE